MITVSLCMIVKNEEKVLKRCLDSVREFADEIIVVDTGSNDMTKELAKNCGAYVFDFEWCDDFAKARNFAFSKGTKEYLMWLDADDIILKTDLKKLLELKKTLSKKYDAVTLRYNTHFDENKNPILTSTRGRLFKREKNFEWFEPVHEYVELKGTILNIDDIFITHKKEINGEISERNLKIYEKQLRSGKKLSDRGNYYYARELKDHGRNIEAIYYFEKFLSDGRGWVEDNIAACFNMGLCYMRLNETQKAKQAYLKSFIYDAPRAEILCEMGYIYKNIGNYETALKWFKLALTTEKPQTMGFVLNDYYGYIPHLEMCVCFDKLGDTKMAEFHNEEAGKIKPQSLAVLANLEYFRIKTEI